MSQQSMHGSITFENIAITILRILQSELECPVEDVWFCHPGNYCNETVFFTWNLQGEQHCSDHFKRTSI